MRGRRFGRGEPLDFPLPHVMAARMEMQRHRRSIELCFDFVFDLGGSDEHATKVAGDTTSFAAPEANGPCAAQRRHREALCAGRLVGTRAIGGSGPVHSYTLQPRDCRWPLTSLRLCAGLWARASTATLVTSPRTWVAPHRAPGASRDSLRFGLRASRPPVALPGIPFAPVSTRRAPGASRDSLRFAPVSPMQPNTFGHSIAESLDFLCLSGRFPLFFGALECGTLKSTQVRGFRTSHGRDPIAIAGFGDSPWFQNWPS